MSWRSVLIASSVGWAAALPLSAAVATHPAIPGVLPIVWAVYGIGSVVCHQLPVRSFHLGTMQLPVCARCTGIYAGAAMAALTYAVHQRFTSRGARRIVDDPVRARRLLLFAATPTLVTLLYEWTTGVMPSNGVRAIAGLPLGAAIAWLLVTVAGPTKPSKSR